MNEGQRSIPPVRAFPAYPLKPKAFWWESARFFPRAFYQIPLLLAGLIILGLSFWLHPNTQGWGTHQQLGLPPCAFFQITGKPCPACGMTTCFSSLAHGHLFSALKANALGVPLFFALLAFLFVTAWGLLKGKQLKVNPDTVSKTMIGYTIGLIGFALIRFLIWHSA